MSTIHSSSSNDPLKNSKLVGTSTGAASPLDPIVSKHPTGSAGSPLLGAIPAPPQVTSANLATSVTPVTSAVVNSPATLKDAPQSMPQSEVEQLQSTVVGNVRALIDLTGVNAPTDVAELQKALSANATAFQSLNNSVITPDASATTRVNLNGFASAVDGNAKGVLQYLSSDLQAQIGLNTANPTPIDFTRIQNDIEQASSVAKANGITKDIAKEQGKRVLQQLGIDPDALG